jgi:hypothetical protein
MSNPLFRSLSLLDPSGYFIIALIVSLLALGVVLTFSVRARYAQLEAQLRRHPDPSVRFEARVLNSIVQDAQNAMNLHAGEINTQAIIEYNFQRELGSLLVAERFVKASTGLLIILGLVGTFYGLTLSIGKLVALVSADVPNAGDIAQSLTAGLTQALSGMSVAFSCSLFGILGAITMTLLSVFANVADRRTALMVQVEAYLDNDLLHADGAPGSGLALRDAGGAHGAVIASARLEQAVNGFNQGLGQLHESIGQFEAALVAFSATTRDFREFNLHLKDNVQRMSLGFADLSETLKAQSHSLRARDPR